MDAQQPFESTPKWFTRKPTSGAVGFVFRFRFYVSSDTMILAFDVRWHVETQIRLFRCLS